MSYATISTSQLVFDISRIESKCKIHNDSYLNYFISFFGSII